MNKNNISKSAFWWIFFLILLVFLIFLGTRQLGVWKTGQEKQMSEPTLEKEIISPDIRESREVVKETSERTIETEAHPEEKESPKPQEKPFTIQLASFQDKARAERLAEELKKKGYTPTISSKDLGEKGIWHRVFVGNFDSEDEARELLKTLKEDYKDSFIKLK